MDKLRIATWNILSDKGSYFNTESQSERLESIYQTLDSLGKMDIVGLLEVENNELPGHHGKLIAQRLAGVDGHWMLNPANREDLDIHSGMFGEVLDSHASHTLVGERSIITSSVGEIAVGLIHFTYDTRGENLRVEQARQALAHMADHDKVILMGDFNSASWQRSRKIIEGAGFTSVFQALGRRRPATIMTEKYRKRLSLGYRLATKYGFSPDDIYVKGLEVVDAGVFEGDSDHRGVWAEIHV